MNNIEIKRGQIWTADIKGHGNIQNGVRPVIILSNNMCNKFSPVIKVITITASNTKKKMPTHVEVKGFGLEKNSIALAEQDMPINKFQLLEYVGTCDRSTMEKINVASMIQNNLGRNVYEIIEDIKREDEFLQYGIPIQKIKPKRNGFLKELKLYCDQFNKNFHGMLKENNILEQVI